MICGSSYHYCLTLIHTATQSHLQRISVTSAKSLLKGCHVTTTLFLLREGLSLLVIALSGQNQFTGLRTVRRHPSPFSMNQWLWWRLHPFGKGFQWRAACGDLSAPIDMSVEITGIWTKRVIARWHIYRESGDERIPDTQSRWLCVFFISLCGSTFRTLFLLHELQLHSSLRQSYVEILFHITFGEALLHFLHFHFGRCYPFFLPVLCCVRWWGWGDLIIQNLEIIEGEIKNAALPCGMN